MHNIKVFYIMKNEIMVNYKNMGRIGVEWGEEGNIEKI
jgi:hypothetical protein